MEMGALANLQEKIQAELVLLLLRPGAAKPWERIWSVQRVGSEKKVEMRLFHICAVFLFSTVSSLMSPHIGVTLNWL